MASPTQNEVAEYVRTTVAAFTNRDAASVKDEMVLTKLPLRMDSNDLVYLSMNLRAYVMVHRVGGGTITVKDTKKANETVGGLAKVVYNRIREA